MIIWNQWNELKIFSLPWKHFDIIGLDGKFLYIYIYTNALVFRLVWKQFKQFVESSSFTRVLGGNCDGPMVLKRHFRNC